MDIFVLQIVEQLTLCIWFHFEFNPMKENGEAEQNQFIWTDTTGSGGQGDSQQNF